MRVSWASGAFPGKCFQGDRTPVKRQVAWSVRLECVGDPAERHDSGNRPLSMAVPGQLVAERMIAAVSRVTTFLLRRWKPSSRIISWSSSSWIRSASSDLIHRASLTSSASE